LRYLILNFHYFRSHCTRVQTQFKMVFANISTLFEVEGRIALVTGGSSGLGFMIAQVKKL
jgi:hypothetical protein